MRDGEGGSTTLPGRTDQELDCAPQHCGITDGDELWALRERVDEFITDVVVAATAGDERTNPILDIEAQIGSLRDQAEDCADAGRLGRCCWYVLCHCAPGFCGVYHI